MLHRRQAIALLGGTAMLPAAVISRRAIADGHASAWTETQQGLLTALMKLRASLDERVTLEWFQGNVYGVVESAMRPLITVNAVAFARYRRTDDGSYWGRRTEVTYHTPLDRRELLTRFENPYTGNLVEVPMSRTPVQDLLIGPDGIVAPPATGPVPVVTESRLGPGTVNGDRCWVRLDIRVRIPAEPGAPPRVTYGESSTYAGSTGDVLDPGVLSAPSQISYVNVMNWRPWLEMGDRPGHTTTVANGQKVESVAALPDDLRGFVEEYHPDLVEDPLGALD